MIENNLLQAISWTLIHSIWQGFVLALFAGIVLQLTKKLTSALRYLLLAFLFVAFIIGNAVTFLHLFQQKNTNFLVPTIPIPGGEIDSLASNTLPEILTNTIQFLNANAFTITAIWFLVFIYQLLMMLVGFNQIHRIRNYQTQLPSDFWIKRFSELCEKVNIKSSITLLESALVKVPSVTGFFKPMILVPIGLLANLSTEQTEAILLHELAHIRRKDFMINIIQRIAEITFFFNPGLIWVSSLLHAERENCCDDIAVAATNKKVAFVHALVSFHEYSLQTNTLAIGFGGTKNSLLQRAKRLVYNDHKSLNFLEKSLMSVGLLITAFFIFAFSDSNQLDKIFDEGRFFISTNSEDQNAIKADRKARLADHEATIADQNAKKADQEAVKADIQAKANDKIVKRLDKKSLSPLNSRKIETKTDNETIEVHSEKNITQAEIDAMTKGIIADLIAEKVINNKLHLSYKLSKNNLIVNGAIQPTSISRKLSDKYVTSENTTVNYSYSVCATTVQK